MKAKNITSQEELRRFSGNINLNYSRYTHLSAIKLTLDIVFTDNKNSKNNIGIISDGMEINNE